MAVLKYTALGLLFLGAAVLLWRSNQPPTPPAETPIEAAADLVEPDVQGKQVLFRQFHPDGSLHYRLRAAGIRQFSDEQTTHLDTPELHLRSDDNPPWDIDARTGFIRQETVAGQPQDTVFLNQNVNMVQQHPSNGQLVMRSDTFYLYPDRQFAQTDEDVTIDTQVGRTQAAGMAINLDTGILTLNSSATQRVHTVILPEHFKDV